MKRVTFTLLVIVTISSAQAKYSGGSGDPNDPYQIATAEDLNDIANHVEDLNKCFIMTSDINLAQYTGTQFNIIGRSLQNGFSGSFNGNGHTVSNLHLETDGFDNVGLFGYVSWQSASPGTIMNLIISEPNIDAGFRDHVGALAGHLNSGIIENCYVLGGSVSGYHYVGGIVGNCFFGSVTNCYSSSDVRGYECVGGLVGCNSGSQGLIAASYSDANVQNIFEGAGHVGGLVGCNQYEASVVSCFADANIYCCGNYNGGLVGYNQGDSVIVDSYSAGSINAFLGSQNGALVGYNSEATIQNCYSVTSVLDIFLWPQEPELIPEHWGLVGCSYFGSIVNCFWDVNVTGLDTIFAEICSGEHTYISNSRGLTTQQMQKLLTYSSWTCNGRWVIDEGVDYPRLDWQNIPGTPISVETVFDKGSGVADDPYLISTPSQIYALGYMPCLWDKHFKLIADIDMDDCDYYDTNPIGFFYVGDVFYSFTGVFDGSGHTISNFKQSSTSDSFVFIGLFSPINDPNAVIKDLGLINPDINAPIYGTGGALATNVVAGKVTRCFVQGGSVRGRHTIGGLLGVTYGPNAVVENCYAATTVHSEYDAGGLICWSGNESTISNCYSVGPVTATDGNTGGLVSNSDPGTVENSFWDVNTSGCPQSAGGVGLTTEQMKQQASFTDWDFNDIWHICETTNYPKLLWQVLITDFLCPDGVDFIDFSFLASHWLQTDYGDVNGIELTGNGKIDLGEFAILGNWWGQTGCGNCGGADYSGNGNADLADLVILCDYWLATDYGDVEGAELTGDGIVDIDDLKVFYNYWMHGF